jgi:hypothetical protein
LAERAPHERIFRALQGAEIKTAQADHPLHISHQQIGFY